MRRTLLALAFASSIYAQSPAFLAADVHLSGSSPMPFMDVGLLPSGRYQIRNATMVDLIKTAWGIDTENVVDGPAWIDTDRFDIIAKVPPKSTAADREEMLRSLLAERFKLAVHNDKKELTVDEMTVNKRGVQLQESGAPGSTDCKGDFNQGPPPMVTVNCPSMTMPQFAIRVRQMAGGDVHNLVVDLTGLKGAYAIALKWTPPGGPKPKDGEESAGQISILDALDKQLGLTIALGKRMVPVVAIDHVERTPTANDPDVTKTLPPAVTEFEAATIKLNKSGKEEARLQPKPGGRVEGENIPLKLLITFAWDFDTNSDDRIVGLPKWGTTDRYDFIAKAAVMPGEQPPPLDDLRMMIRALLIERFKITLHTEDQPVKVFTLTVGKRGSKLRAADPSARSTCNPSMGQSGSGAAKLPALTLTCQNTTMAQLATAMHLRAGGYVDHPVVDLTELKGGYDFVLTWTPRGALSSSGRGGAKAAETESASDPSGGTTFFDAVEK
jgi:uncharacterized protein (TIGR03435 family)